MKIIIINSEQRHNTLIDELVSVWEKSVRASHFFLTEKDILQIRQQVKPALNTIPTLIVAFDNDKPIGFAGIYKDKLEMLFISPDYFRQGIGYKLITFSLKQYHIRFVDVNEQNPQALKFYQRQGFTVFKRSPFDSENRPFPILHLQKN